VGSDQKIGQLMPRYALASTIPFETGVDCPPGTGEPVDSVPFETGAPNSENVVRPFALQLSVAVPS
jgi:hypothetical protein